jgi:hypothetical protein
LCKGKALVLVVEPYLKVFVLRIAIFAHKENIRETVSVEVNYCIAVWISHPARRTSEVGVYTGGGMSSFKALCDKEK